MNDSDSEPEMSNDDGVAPHVVPNVLYGSDSDTEQEDLIDDSDGENVVIAEKRGKKRKRNPKRWKVNIRKQRKVEGD